MLEPCWRYFSLLGASWAHFARLAAFVASLGRFFGVLARSGLDFTGVRVGLGRVLEPPGPRFSRFCAACALALSDCSECNKTTVLLGRNTIRKHRAQREKLQKIAPGAFRTSLLRTVAAKTRLGACRARFWRGLGASRACLGRVWGALGQLLSSFGTLLGVTWAPFSVCWALLVASGLAWMPKLSKGRPRASQMPPRQTREATETL